MSSKRALGRDVSRSFWLPLVAAAALGLANIADTVRRPIASDAVEGSVLAAQEGLRRGLSLYDPSRWTHEPFGINLYGPVFYRLGAWLLRLWGGPPTLAAGRAVSVAALCVSWLLIWRISRRHLSLGRESSAAALLAAVSFPPFWGYGPLNRVDALAATISLGAIACALEGGRALWATPVLFVIAIFTKPTAIAAPLTVVVWLLAERRWRQASALAAISLALGALWLAVEQRASSGGFVRSVLEFNRNPMHLHGGLQRLMLVSRGLVLPAAGAVALLAGLRAQGNAARLSLYFLVSAFIATATISKIGAAPNYYLEAGLAMSLIVGWALERWRGALARSGALATATMMLWATVAQVSGAMRTREQRASSEQQVERVLRGKYALTSELTPLLQQGGWPVVGDPYIFARLAESGVIDQRPLLRTMAEGRVEVVVVDADLAVAGASNLWTDELRREVLRHYALQDVIRGRAWVYVPLRDAGARAGKE